jgi:multidrug efflux pump subunit AcrB/outer membrane protein TolC
VIDALLRRTRLIVVLVGLLTLVGLASWLTMPRQEDPSFAERFASLVVPFPGASALDVERLVLAPVEEALEEVTELREVASTARPGVAVFTLRLQDAIAFDATDAAWDEVRRAMESAQPDLPAEALPPDLDTQVGDPATAVFLLTGPDGTDVLALRRAAKRLEAQLQRVPGVERVELLGDPGRRIAIGWSPDVADRMGLSAPALAQQLQARNVTVPGGSVEVGGRSLILRHQGELTDLDRIRAVPLVLPSGAAVSLGSVATVTEEPAVPPTERVLHDGLRAVGVSVVPVPEQDLVALGGRIDAALSEVDTSPFTLHRFAFQPTLVEDRIGGLTGSLVLGIVIVACVLFVAMGPRMGVVVSAIVPLVALGTIAVYAVGGGILHQISIAAVVLALGLLVDNAIVVAESVQQHLDAGHPDPGAAAVRELGIPLGTATGTTVAAFVPMLLSSGGTADFTRAIPIVVILALLLSYLYALVVTPTLAGWMLTASPGQASRLERPGRVLARWTVGRPKTLLFAVGLGLAATAGLAAFVPAEFFPMSDRDRLVVSVALPEGTHADSTLDQAGGLADVLRADPRVESATAFVGGGLPRFYYNLNDSPNSPHRAEIVLSATPGTDLDALAEHVRHVARGWPDATVVPARLQQGPPVGAPIQIRLQGDDLDALATATRSVTEALRTTPGARDVRHDLGTGIPTLDFTIDDVWTGRFGVGRAAVPLATLAQTHGLAAGVIRNGSDPIDIRVASLTGEKTATDALLTAPVATADGAVPLMQLADWTPTWQPAAIRHRDGNREVTVSAELASGVAFGSVLGAFEAQALDLPQGVTVSYGGEAEGSGEANTALLQTLPLGVGLLVFFLLLEFDSVRRLGIVLTTVPLAAVGVVPGLALTGEPFGFMSMLGVIALVGIVVNNAIVLMNRVERMRETGLTVPEAVTEAIQMRLRPILLTTATTVAGLLPLALSDSGLWPPLAWAMISGLMASTALTLVVVPALYVVLFGWEDANGATPARGRWWRRVLPAALLFPSVAGAAPWTLDQVVDAAETAPLAIAADADADAAARTAAASWLSVATPTLGAQADSQWIEEEIAIDTPIGPFVQQPKRVGTVGVSVQQPLFDPSGWAASRASSHGARATRLQAERTRERIVQQAVETYLDLVVVGARIDALDVQADALDRTASQARDLVDAGLALPSDAMRAAVALADVRQTRALLDAQRSALEASLAAQLGVDAPIEVAGLSEAPVRTSSRPDLQAAEQAQQARRLERVAVATSLLPRVVADVGWNGTDNETLVASNWTRAGVTATWSLGAGRLARVDAASAQIAAAGARRDGLARGVGAERTAAAAVLDVRIAEVAVRRTSEAQAAEAARILEDRYAEQLATLTDVLAAQADRANQSALRIQAEAEVVRATVALAVAGGRPASE